MMQRRRVVRQARPREERRAEAVLRQRPREEARRLRSVDEHDAPGADLRPRRRHPRRPPAQGGHSRRIVGADPAAGPARHPGQLRRRRRRPARCSARPASSSWTRRPAWCGRRGTCCTSTSTSRAASARRAAKAATGCYKILAKIERGEGEMRDIDLLVSVGEQHRRQDAVRVRRRGGDAGADDGEALPRRVRGARPRRAAAPCRPTGARPRCRWRRRTDAGFHQSRRSSPSSC